VVPERIKLAIDSYVEYGTDDDRFVTAVLENNLSAAVACADHIAMSNLYDIVSYVYCKVPSICYGSRERVDAWIDEMRKEREEKVRQRENVDTVIFPNEGGYGDCAE
jgi:hypothetical protein